jgi:hypothetical protein
MLKIGFEEIPNTLKGNEKEVLHRLKELHFSQSLMIWQSTNDKTVEQHTKLRCECLIRSRFK